MTQTVEGPDGIVHEFPDAATPDQIQAAMRKEYNIKPPENYGFSERNNGGIEGQINGLNGKELSGNSLLAGRIQNVLNGATLNIAGNVIPYESAALDAVTGRSKTPFWENVDYYRNQSKELGNRMFAERPVETVGSQIAGGLLTGGALTRAATGVIGAAAPTTAAALRAGTAGLGAKIAQGAVAGGIGGGVAGAAAGDDLNSRVAGGVAGAGLGATLGGAIPMATSGLGALGRGLQSVFLPGTVNATDRAAGILGETVARSGMRPGAVTPATALQDMNGRGVNNAALADLSDELTSLTGAVSRSPGQGRQIVGDFLRARQEGDPSLGQAGGGQWVDLVRDITDKVSPSVSSKRAAEAIITNRSNEAKPLYEEAFKVGNLNSPVLSDLAQIPTMRAALSRGVNMAKQEGVLPSGYKLDASKPVPIQVWHQAKIAIDDLIGAASRGGQKGQARSLLSMQGRLLDELDTATNGLYGQARNNFAGNSAVLNALEDGKAILQKATTAEDISDALDNLTSHSEIEAFKAGAAQALRDTVTRVGRKGNAAAQFLNRPDMQLKLQALFKGEPGKYEDFISRVMGRDRLYRTYAELGGSPTAGRTNAEADLQEGIIGGPDKESLFMATAKHGRSGFVRAAMQRLQDGSVRLLSDKVRTELARMLTSSDPAEVRQAAVLIQNAAEMAKRGNILNSRIQGALTQGAVQPAVSTAQQGNQ